MTTPHEPQRFPDRRGWLRNRRAVVLDGDGLTVERWIGGAARLPWGDVLATTWLGPDLIEVEATGRTLLLDRFVDGVHGLGQAIDAAMLARADDDGQIPVAPEDIERWLGGFHVAIVTEGHAPTPASGTGLASWPVIGAVYARCHDLMAARRRRPSCRVVVGPSGVEVQRRGQLPEEFAWTQVVHVESGPDRHTVTLSDGRAVSLPASGELEPLLGAIRMVLAHRAGYHAQPPPVPLAALSPSAPPSASHAAEHGVSRAAPASEADPAPVAVAARPSPPTGLGEDENPYALAAITGASLLIVWLNGVTEDQPPLLAGTWICLYLLWRLPRVIIEAFKGCAPQRGRRRRGRTWAALVGEQVVLGDGRGPRRTIELADVASVAVVGSCYRIQLQSGQTVMMPEGAGVTRVVAALRAAVGKPTGSGRGDRLRAAEGEQDRLNDA
ncbi:MAG: hypothetical protein HZB16_06455 [Armatimonadetes bacterium]|nr:hypothetical protein [Armatimonadota bacterium]